MSTARRVSVPASRRGWLLVSLIIFLSVTLLVLASFSFLLSEHLRSTSLRQDQTKAIYLAQAGVMQAIYDVRQTTGGIGFRLGEYRADTGAFGPIGSFPNNDVFILGGQAADFLLATMIPGTLTTVAAPGGCGGGTRQRLRAWTLRNVLLSKTSPDGMPISFNQMAVSWSSPRGEAVIRIDLNGTGQDWPPSGCGSAASGTTVTLNSLQTIPSATLWGTNRIWFSTTTMSSKAWIELAFFMSDVPQSTRRVRFLPPPNASGSSANFTVKAIGEVRQGSFPFGPSPGVSVWRRLQAEYRLNETDPTNLQAVGSLKTDTALLLSPAVSVTDQRPGYNELTQRSP